MLFLLVCFLSLLAACGAPSSGPDSAARTEREVSDTAADPAASPLDPSGVSTVEAASDDRPVIVAFGDSLTAGYGLPRGKSYPDLLQRALDDKGYRYRVRNEGISGDTTSGGLARCALAAESAPAFAIVALGGNDGLRGLAPDRMKQNLRGIVKAFTARGTKVVLGGMKLPPNYGAEYTQAFEGVFHELADELDLPLVPFLLEGVGGRPEFMQNDGIHPNEEGTSKVADLVMRHLEPVLAER